MGDKLVETKELEEKYGEDIRVVAVAVRHTAEEGNVLTTTREGDLKLFETESGDAEFGIVATGKVFKNTFSTRMTSQQILKAVEDGLIRPVLMLECDARLIHKGLLVGIVDKYGAHQVFRHDPEQQWPEYIFKEDEDELPSDSE